MHVLIDFVDLILLRMWIYALSFYEFTQNQLFHETCTHAFRKVKNGKNQCVAQMIIAFFIKELNI